VMVNYVAEDEQAQAVVKEIHKRGGHAHAHRADVSQEDQVKAMFRKMISEFGTIDILINNAGLQRDAPIDVMTLEQWDRVIGVNLTGQFLCSREAIREFKRRGVVKEVSCSAGKIICISSVHEIIPWAGHVNYAASKGGVMMMMKSIAPGAIRTPINAAAWSTPEAYEDLMALIPYKRIGEPEDIGRASVWLASDYADYVTGTSLIIDGGMTLYPGFQTGG
jgi:glucose 1-dehydrogenase